MLSWIETHQLWTTIIGGVAVIIIGGVITAIWKALFAPRDNGDDTGARVMAEHLEKAVEERADSRKRIAELTATLKKHNIDPATMDAQLAEMVARDKDMRKALEDAPPVDDKTDDLRARALASIDDGDEETAEDLLREAEVQDTQAIAQHVEETANRQRAAAASAQARGDIAFNRLDYPTAATHFQRAANLLPDGDTIEKAEALNMAGRAFGESAAFTEAEAAYSEARPLFESSLAADDHKFGTLLNNLAHLYQATNRLAEAEPLMERALTIGEKAFGDEHPKIATRLNNLARLYQDTYRLDEAEPLMARALDILTTSLGADHPNTQTVANNLTILRAEIAAGKP